jgi:hypothetical protein
MVKQIHSVGYPHQFPLEPVMVDHPVVMEGEEPLPFLAEALLIRMR